MCGWNSSKDVLIGILPLSGCVMSHATSCLPCHFSLCDSLCDISVELIHNYSFYSLYLLRCMNSASYSSQKGYEPEATFLKLPSAVFQRFVVQSSNLLYPKCCHFQSCCIALNWTVIQSAVSGLIFITFSSLFYPFILRLFYFLNSKITFTFIIGKLRWYQPLFYSV